MPGLIIDGLSGNGERVGVGNEEITVHVVARGDTRGGVPAGIETMSRILRDAAGIHDPDGVQHGAAVLVEHDALADGVAYLFQAYTLRLKSAIIEDIVRTFDGRVVHEIHFDEAQSPVAKRRISLLQIVLGAGIGGIQNVEWILLADHVPDVNELAGGVMEQPLLMVLKHPGTFRYFKGSGPQSEGEAAVTHQIRDVADPEGKELCVRSGVFAACI